MSDTGLGQLMTMGLPGGRLDDEWRAFIRRVRPGGFILFRRNLRSPRQVRDLCDELRSLCDAPPILTLDQEGGRVSRLREIGEEPPSADALRRAGRVEWIEEHGRLTGQLLRMFGFNLNLAPVADILLDSTAENSLLNRCYGTTPEEAAAGAGAFLRAMQAEGVLGTIKHFPGYSMCTKDPHGALPVVDRTRSEMEPAELKVFRTLQDEAACVMIGHAVYPAFDGGRVPSSLSKAVIHGLLKTEMGYGGLVMTDDLEMGAIAGEYGVGPTVRMAMGAGNDLLLFCHQRECVDMALGVLERMPRETLAPALAAMAKFKERLSPPAAWDEAALADINRQIKALREKVAAAAVGPA